MTSDFSPTATHITPLKVPYAVAVPSSVASLPVVSQANISSFVSSSHRFPSHSPSPGILNFTLQNLGLINPGMHFSVSRGPSMMTASPEQAASLAVRTNLQQGKMIFVKPVSPHHHPIALFSLPQVSSHSNAQGYS